MNNWKNYLRTALITLSAAGLPTFTAYSYYKTQDQIERAGSMLDRNSHLKEEILDDIRIQKGWHLCGMETVGARRENYPFLRQPVTEENSGTPKEIAHHRSNAHQKPWVGDFLFELLKTYSSVLARFKTMKIIFL